MRLTNENRASQNKKVGVASPLRNPMDTRLAVGHSLPNPLTDRFGRAVSGCIEYHAPHHHFLLVVSWDSGCLLKARLLHGSTTPLIVLSTSAFTKASIQISYCLISNGRFQDAGGLISASPSRRSADGAAVSIWISPLPNGQIQRLRYRMK